MPLEVVAYYKHSYGSSTMIICILIGSCSMAWTQWTALHHYCSTQFPFDPPTQSVTYSQLLDIYTVIKSKWSIYCMFAQTAHSSVSSKKDSMSSKKFPWISVCGIIFVLSPKLKSYTVWHHKLKNGTIFVYLDIFITYSMMAFKLALVL